MSEEEININTVDTDSNLTDWKNPPTVEDLKQDYTEAQSSHDHHVSNVESWLDNLYITGSAKVDRGDTRSSITPKLIRKQAEWRYSALAEPFLSTEDLFEGKPVSWEDKKAAEQNVLILNNQFNTKIDKVKFIADYVRTCVNEGTVVARTGWDSDEIEEEIDVPQYQMVPIQDPTYIQQQQQIHELMEANPTAYQQLTDEEKANHQLFMESQGQLMYVVTGYQKETVIRVTKNQPTVEVCDYRNVIVDPTCMGDLSKAAFVIFSFETSLSELEKDGKYSNLENINFTNATVPNDPDYHSMDDSYFNFRDKPRKKLIAYEYWGWWDINDEGVTRPIVATWVEDTLIRLEENPMPDGELPFVIVQYLPRKHEIYGEPDGELLKDNQDIIGAVTRGMIDTMARSANGQQAIRKDALDPTNRRKFDKGLDYEFNANIDPRQAFYMHEFPEIPQSAQYMIDLQNNEAESLTGVKAFHSGISGRALGHMLDINTLIPKSDGTLVKLADVQDGDQIIGSNGGFTTVIKAHGIKYPKAAYNIAFSNGAVIKSGIEHLWTVKVTGTKRELREWHTVDTATLFNYYLMSIDNKSVSVYVPRVHRPRTTKIDVPIDPYCLGAWLGDGNSHGARITSLDSEIVDRFAQAGFLLKEGASQNSGKAVNYDVMDSSGNTKDSETGQFISNPDTFHTKLKNLDLLKRYGGEKHIPEEYFEADYYIKLELLRGLMDTDGYAHSGAFNIFCQTEGRLKDDVIRLLYSMGTIPHISKCVSADELNRRKSTYTNKGLSIKSNTAIYEIGFTLPDNPFYISRKADKYSNPVHNNTFRITSMIEVDKVLMRCLTVDSADKLYAVGKEFTLTHNTATGVRSAMDATSKRDLDILRRLSDGLVKIGRKVVGMNSAFLSEEEIVRVTNDQFVTVNRDDLNGNFDLSLSISTAEADNEKAQELSFMLQTMGNSMPMEFSQMLLSDIAKLRKMPDLAKRIAEYQPQPDPLAQKQRELEVALLEAQVFNEQAKGKENAQDIQLKAAKTESERAKARNLDTKSDKDDLDFVEQAEGIKHNQELDKKDFDRKAKLDELAANQLFNPQPTNNVQ